MPQTDPTDRFEPFPLTEIQESFYVGRTLGPSTGAGTQIHLEFEADDFDTVRAESAWNDVVAATDMLRAHVLPDARQVVRAEVPFHRFVRVDLSTLGPEAREAELARLRREALAGSDPHRWPLFAIRVAGLPGGRARVLFTVDELIADGPSVSLLLQQWYERYARGTAVTEPALTFRAYCAAGAGAEAPEESLAYWRARLADVDLDRPLPLAGGSASAPGHRRIALRMEPERWERVREAAKQARATPTALLLALCTAAVQGTGDPAPLPVVLTTYNRRRVHPDVPRLVGPFISTSVFVAPPATGTAGERLDRVRERLWNDLEHAAVSGVRALREHARAEPGNRAAAVPMVFTSLLGSLTTLGDDPDSWAAHVDLEASATLTPGVHLESCVQERAGALLVSWDFAPTAVDETRTLAAFEALRAALEHIADEGGAALSEPAALPAAEPIRDPAAEAQQPAADASSSAPVPLTEVQSAYLVGRIGGLGGDAETRVYQEFLLRRHEPDRLEDAWNRLLAHHPMLRARVHEDGTLTVKPAADRYRIARHDLTAAADPEAELERIAARLRATAFPLGSDPMYALEASTLPDGTVVLHVVLDALLADARSFALLFGQLFALHDGDDTVLAGPADPTAHLRALPALRRSPAGEQARAAWREKFAALPSGPDLPEPAPGAPRAHRRTDLGSWRALTERAAAIGVPADMVLFTAYSDELRAEFGAAGPFAVTVVSWDRPRALAHADAMVADFTQLAWVTVDDTLPDDFAARARVLWERVRADLERAELVPGLGELRTRVFRSAGSLRLPVVFTRVPEIDPALHPAGVELRTSQSQTAQVALDHVPLLVGDRLMGQWDAAEGALAAGRLDAMFERYARRVRRFVAGPPTQFTQLTQPEQPVREAVGPVGSDDPTTLVALVEAALTGRADREAVRHAGGTLTYGELDRRSARLARRLHELGVRPGDHVAVHMDRSERLVSALVGIVRSGAVYVPVDPANPPERVRYLLEDSGARVVVADAALAEVPEQAGAVVICPDRDADRAALHALPAVPPPVSVAPDDPVYTIYTSGTTGRPKGCRNSQQGVANRILWMQARFPLTARDRVAQKTPYGFDVSVWEFFWPLVAGAALVVARPGGHTDPAYLARLLRTERVTVTHFVPSVLGMFLRHPEAAEDTALRLVFTSGEALPVTTMRRFYTVFGTAGPELHNLYGPTEAAIDVTHWACRPDWDEPTVPIGRPVAGTSIHVVDDRLSPVPPGVAGEILIGGRQVALGYHDRPELTAERFVTSPFPALDPSPRLYRTGDLGLLGADGEIRYLGRADGQFKLRGLRIEPEEIEAALVAVPGIADARVLPVDDPARGEQILAALCVPGSPADPPGVGRVRGALADALPGYLIPNRFRFVADLPLTTNGKLDRRAAAALFDAEPRSEADASTGQVPGPVGADVRTRVRAAVAGLLGVTGLDDGDDLFDLGATSFTMIRVAQEIERLTGTALPVDALISRPTLGALLRAALPDRDEDRGKGEDQGEVPGEGQGRGPASDRTPAPPAAPGALDAHDVARRAAAVLGVGQVGPDDDLFDLGATSFTMIRLAQEIEAGTGVQVPVDVLIQSPTPRSIARGVTPAPASAPAVAAARPRSAEGTDVLIALDPAAKAAFKEARVAERRLPETLLRVPVPLAGAEDRRALFDASSFREFAEGPLPAEDLLALLATVTWGDLDGRDKRRYPSGGGFYPVQVYVYAAPGAVRGLDAGLYYLHPAERALVALAPDARYGTDLHVHHNRPLVEGAGFGVFLVSTPAAIAPAYGTRNAARFSTIEAGHIAQLLLTGGPERGLGLCAVGEMDFDAVRGDFGVGDDQELLLSLWGGALTEAARARRAALAPGHGPVPGPAPVPAAPPAARPAGRAVAVVGFAADLPGARTLDELDALLSSATPATGPVPADRWAPLRATARRAGAARGGYLDDVLAVENEEFRIPEDEAGAIDPQERLLLSVARRCFEDAALTPDRLGRVGVFVGSMWQDHALYGVAARADGRTGDGTHATRGGLAHRTSHAFGLTGPSVLLDSGCVSGLAAVEAAYRAVADGRCEAALAAGANLVLHPDHLDVLSEMGLVAEDADSCAFTDRASGWLVGEGVGALLLKPLEQALADGDPVHAVLRGGALEHSGTTRQFGVPDPARQEATMRSALDDAGLRPDDIGYVEAAAAGAALADALEFTALGRLFDAPQGAAGADAARPEPVPVGTVKPHTGHLEAASVFAQLGKVIAQFRRREVYPTLLTSAVNPALAGAAKSVALATDGAGRWRTAPGAPRRVLVNGFAGGGSYGSLVVEEPPATRPGPDDGGTWALPLSADTAENLAALADSLAALWERDPSLGAGRVARALREGRTERPVRAGLVTDAVGAPAALRLLARRVRGEGGALVAAGADAPGPEKEALTAWVAGERVDWPAVAAPRAALPATPLTRTRPPLPTGPGSCEAPSAPEVTPAPEVAGALSDRLGPVWGIVPPAAPEPQAPRHGSGTSFARLAPMVAAELGTDPGRLAPEQDLFALGATSRQLLRLSARITAGGGQEVSLETLFTASDLGELAERAFPAPVTV
ncbi:amino acid adenylation domain-containing protein [Streptomyces sp. NPDC006172]|uniref:amino acid adenylation domain-containing protein n=1 Tax=Streptomyces sp. NPDC006172 TaxID=3154470 RepID=UPI0033E2E790